MLPIQVPGGSELLLCSSSSSAPSEDRGSPAHSCTDGQQMVAGGKKIGQEQQRPSLTAESFPHKLSNNPPFHLLSAPQLLLWLELTISTAAKPAARRISDPTHQTPLPPFPALSLPLSLLASNFSVEFTEIYLSQLIMPTFIDVTLVKAHRYVSTCTNASTRPTNLLNL